MDNLYVILPSGLHAIVPIDGTGSYYDPARVLWDERADGQMPAVTLGKMQRSGDTLITLQDYVPAHLAAELVEAKSVKIEQLKLSYETDNYADIEHNGKTYRADKHSQELLAAVLSVGSVPSGMYWRDITGVQNAVSFSDLQALAGAILARGLTLDSNLDTKTAAVNAATNVSEVNAVVW